MPYLIGYGVVNLTPGPTGINLDGNLVNPNGTANTTFGNFTPAGGNFPFAWNITAGPNHYQLSGNVGNTVAGQISATGVGNLTPGTIETITVSVTDANSLSFHQNFPLSISTLPVSISLAPNIVVETAATGTLVGGFHTTGGDPPYGYGGWDNANFTQTSTQLFLSAIGHGNITGNTTAVGNVTSTDSFGNSVTAQQTISITVAPSSSLPTPPPNPPEGFNVLWNLASDPTVAPGVTEGGAGTWKIANATTAFASIDGHTYATVDAIYNAASVIGSFYAHFPIGYFIINGVLLDVSGITVSWQGSGVDLTWFRTVTDTNVIFTPHEDTFTSRMYVYDQSHGPFPFESVPRTANITGSISGTVLNVTNVADGNVTVGAEIEGVSVKSNTFVIGLLGNSSGGIGNYTVSKSQTIGSEAMFLDNSQFQWGQNSLNYFSHALVVYNNFNVTRINSNGLQTSDYFGDIQAQQAELWLFNGRISCCGNTNLVHNAYIHNLRRFYVQNVFSHTSAGHALKCDAQRTDLIDVTAAGRYDANGPSGFGTGNPPLNATRDTDYYGRRVLILPTFTPSVTASMIMATRNETGGYVGKKVPDYYRRSVNGKDARQILWEYGGDDATPPSKGGPLYDPTLSEHSVGQADATYVAGNTRIGFKFVNAMTAQTVGGTLVRDLGDTGAHGYDVEMVLDDFTTVVRTSATMVSHIGNGTAPGRFVCDIDTVGGIPAGRSFPLGFPAAFKRNGNSTGGAQNWDFFVLDASTSPRHNPADPNYFWPQIKDAFGNLDITKSNLPNGYGFYVQFHEDPFIVPLSSTSNGAKVFVQAADDNQMSYCTTGNVMEMPLSPLKSNVAAWGNLAGMGDYVGHLQGASPIIGHNGSGGTGINGSDEVETNMMISMPLNIYDLNILTSANRVNIFFNNVAPPSNGPFNTGRCLTNTNYLDASGVIHQTAQNSSTAPLPPLARFTATASLAAFGTVLHVSSVAGITAGACRGAIQAQRANGDPFMHAFNVISVNAGALTITIDPVPDWLTIPNGAFGSVNVLTPGVPNGVLQPQNFQGYKP